MPDIEVEKPFGLRLNSKTEKREFNIGRHTVSEEELAHWYMKACLSPKDGRAVLLADAEKEESGSGELTTPTKSQLNALNRDKLDQLAAACGIEVPEGANKAAVIELLLAGQEGVTLIKGPDGVFVQKVGSAPQPPGGSSQAKPDDAPVQKAE